MSWRLPLDVYIFEAQWQMGCNSTKLTLVEMFSVYLLLLLEWRRLWVDCQQTTTTSFWRQEFSFGKLPKVTFFTCHFKFKRHVYYGWLHFESIASSLLPTLQQQNLGVWHCKMVSKFHFLIKWFLISSESLCTISKNTNYFSTIWGGCRVEILSTSEGGWLLTQTHILRLFSWAPMMLLDYL